MAEGKSNKVLIIVIVAAVLALPLLGCLVVFLAGGASWFLVRSAPAPVVVDPVPTTSPDEASLRYALERWQVDQGLASCPTLDDLDARGLLMPGQRNDAWGHPWAITCSGARITATSMGPDGSAGTSDDRVITVGN